MVPDYADLPVASLPDKDEGFTKFAEALSDLYNLLEQYAPTWYTQAHREKARATLRLAKGGTRIDQ